jgi:hypothetical protein
MIYKLLNCLYIYIFFYLFFLFFLQFFGFALCYYKSIYIKNLLKIDKKMQETIACLIYYTIVVFIPLK